MIIEEKTMLMDATTKIVSAANVPHAELTSVIEAVYGKLSQLHSIGTQKVELETVRPEPAVNIKKSIHPDYIVCLEDGKKLKMLKRYLATNFNMTPDQYRERWGLPSDYPMVSPNYSVRRSSLAKQIGLGRKAA